MKKYYIDLFGCAKNQVDAETMMACLNSAGWSVADCPSLAEIIIVNSCGFIESAKRESIDAVLSWRHLYPEKKILLAGCLSQRYTEDLAESLPEADGFFGVEDVSKIAGTVNSLVQSSPDNSGTPVNYSFNNYYRPLLSPPGSAYVKIAEGCNNRCSYCAIPFIRSSLKSRKLQDIIDESKTLLDRGIQELCVIAQDIASYGRDIMSFGKDIGASNTSLTHLLEALSRLDGKFWVRLLYIHPDNFPLPILDIMKNDQRILPYFDLPFQHGSQKILRLMNRRGSAGEYLDLIKNIRSDIPGAVIRTSFMTGFPGETEDDFKDLLDFQEAAQLDWMGCFTYSREEGTPAWSMKKRVPKKTALSRKNLLEERQIPITEKQMDRFVNCNFDVLIEEKIEGEENLWLGRLPCHAPDIDGSAVITTNKELEPGTLIKGKVTARAGFDLKVQALSSRQTYEN